MAEEEKQEEPEPIDKDVPRMTDEQLKEFVLGLCDGKLLTSAQVRQPDLIPMIFLPVAFGVFNGWSKEEIENIGVLWEWNDRAGLRGINGYPIFSSLRMMHKEDWKRAVDAHEREMKRREEIVV